MDGDPSYPGVKWRGIHLTWDLFETFTLALFNLCYFITQEGKEMH